VGTIPFGPGPYSFSLGQPSNHPTRGPQSHLRRSPAHASDRPPPPPCHALPVPHRFHYVAPSPTPLCPLAHARTPLLPFPFSLSAEPKRAVKAVASALSASPLPSRLIKQFILNRCRGQVPSPCGRHHWVRAWWATHPRPAAELHSATAPPLVSVPLRCIPGAEGPQIWVRHLPLILLVVSNGVVTHRSCPSIVERHRTNGTPPPTLVTPVRWALATLRLPGACLVRHWCLGHWLHPGLTMVAAPSRPPWARWPRAVRAPARRRLGRFGHCTSWAGPATRPPWLSAWRSCGPPGRKAVWARAGFGPTMGIFLFFSNFAFF
jgi:hypothetical protein